MSVAHHIHDASAPFTEIMEFYDQNAQGRARQCYSFREIKCFIPFEIELMNSQCQNYLEQVVEYMSKHSETLIQQGNTSRKKRVDHIKQTSSRRILTNFRTKGAVI